MQDRFFSGQFVNHIEGRSLDFDCTATELGLKTNSLPEFYGHWNKSIMYEKQKKIYLDLVFLFSPSILTYCVEVFWFWSIIGKVRYIHRYIYHSVFKSLGL